MLRTITRQVIARSRVAPKVCSANFNMVKMPVRSYFKDNVIMEREYGDGYMADPVSTAERIVRLLALHDNVKDPS